jgi:sugar phosphate permease
MDGVAGLAGWQWLFLVEGVPAVALGVIVLFVLTDRPRDATWLSETERAALVAVLERDSLERTGGSETTVAGVFASGRVWLLALIYFTIPVALYAFGFWLPQILKSEFAGSDLDIGIISAVPYLLGAIGMVVAARHSDETGERRVHVASAALIGAIGFALSAVATNVVASVAALSLAMVGLASMFGPFWALATSTVAGTGAAAAIALINSVGNTGGFVGPSLVGLIRDRTNSFAGGLIGVALILGLIPLLALTMRDGRR